MLDTTMEPKVTLAASAASLASLPSQLQHLLH